MVDLDAIEKMSEPLRNATGMLATLWSATDDPVLRVAELFALCAELRAAREENERLHVEVAKLIAAIEAPLLVKPSTLELGAMTERKPGDSAWGTECSKHGLGYGSGCVCCANEAREDAQRRQSLAEWDKRNAIEAAAKVARAALKEPQR